MTNAKEAKEYSPTLARLLKSRLAPIRETALLTAATSDEKPVKPAAGDCCGSSCNPCVMDLYREELKVWKECAEYRELLGGNKAGGSSVEISDSLRRGEEQDRRVPGAFEW